MFRIALCDDDAIDLYKTKEMLMKYKERYPDCLFEIREFSSMNALLFDMSETTTFDLLILDIYMTGLTGIDGARKLRDKGFEGLIIFLTSSKEHGLAAFDVDANQYLVKPVKESRFCSILDKVFQKKKEENRRFIALRTENEVRRIAIHEIVYCETQGHNSLIHLTKGEILRCRMKLSELYMLVSEYDEFSLIGKIYLVNLGYVDSLTAKFLNLTTGKTIYLPRGSYRSLKEKYFQYYRGIGR